MLKRLDSVEDRQFDPGAGAPPPETGKFDLWETINFAWRKWRFIAAVTALFLLVGALQLSRETPLYTATVQLLLDPQREKALGQDANSDSALDDPEIESQIAIIRSASLLRRVATKGKLVSDAALGPSNNSAPDSLNAGGNPLATVRSWFFGDPNHSAANGGAPAPKSESAVLEAATMSAVGSLQGRLAVTHLGESRVLNVSFTDADPQKAANLANAIADAYVVDKLDARFEAAQRASSWLNDRLVELKAQLRTAEEAVAQFRADNNLQGSGQTATLSQEQLGQLNGRLVAARAETAEKKARLDLLQKFLAAGGGFENLPEIASGGAIADLRKQATDLERQQADLLSRYSDRHPLVVNIRAQLADVRRSILAEAKRLADDVQHDYEMAMAREQANEKTLREVSGETGLDQTKAITLRELERNVAVNKSLFEDFLQRARITQTESSFEAHDARVITPAVPPGAPSSPNRSRTMTMSLLLGLVAGIGGAYLIEMLNVGFTTPRQVEELLGLPLLASISHLELQSLRGAEGAPLTLQQYPIVKPLSRFSEGIRSLRSAVRMSDVDHPPRTLLVTSTLPGEGKSTIAMTLAASASQAGMRVLIVDADLRRPSTSKFFNLEKKVGLVEYLVGGVELAEAIVFDQGMGVWVLPSGGKTQNPPDLLGSDRFKSLVDDLRAQFDLTIYDAPPIGPVVDALIVAPIVDKVVFVVRWARTARELVAHAIERLPVRRKVAGIVLNQVIDAQAQKYGKYAYNYYHGDRYYKNYYSE